MASWLSRRQFLATSAVAAAAGAGNTAVAHGLVPAISRGQASVTKPAAPPAATRILAEWVAGCAKSAVPADARKEAVRSLVNWIAVTVGGATQDAATIAFKTLAVFPTTPGVNIFGQAGKLDPLRAAMINGMSSHVLDFDDTDLRTVVHPAGAVAAALFALAQTHPMSGEDFLHAFILGVEVECRLGLAIYPSHYDMGWHITGTCGAFGAAAGCAKAMGLDAKKTQMAIGTVATEAAGLKVTFGSMSKSLNVGRAAESGLLAAMLAAKGFTGAEDAIEGKGGYIEAASRQHDYGLLVDGLGEHFQINHNTYKPFACGIVAHPSIDAVIQLRKQYNLKPEDVKSIVLKANPLVQELTGKKEPRVGLEGKFSIYHSVAIALIRGHAGPDDYSDEAVQNAGTVALRGRVTLTTDPAVRTDEVFVTLTTADGKVLEKHIEHAVGSIDAPLTDDDLSEKFKLLGKGILAPAQLDELLAKTWGIEKLADAAELARLGAVRAKA